jgi:hypothetical protein
MLKSLSLEGSHNLTASPDCIWYDDIPKGQRRRDDVGVQGHDGIGVSTYLPRGHRIHHSRGLGARQTQVRRMVAAPRVTL